MFSLDQKMSEKEVTLFFNLRGLYFLSFFDTSKTERARAFLSFSDKPQAIQDEMGGLGVVIPCSLTISVFFNMALS